MFVGVRNGVLDGDYSAGAYAKKAFKQGEIVIDCHTLEHAPAYTTEKTYLTIQVSDHKHVLVSKPAVCFNHSCNPNVWMNPCVEPICFRALRDIAEDEELFFNYPSTEWQMIQPFECQCKSPNCSGKVAGAKFLNSEQIAAMMPYCSDFIKSKLAAPFVEVRSGVLKGDFSAGVFALKPFKKGELVINCETLSPAPARTSLKNYLTIQVQDEEHVLVSPPAVCVNHGCEPNLAINPCVSPVAFVALRDIAENEELFFNYISTEWEMAQPFPCQCKSPVCLGEVRGARFLNEKQAAAVRPYCSDFIKSKLTALHSSASASGENFDGVEIRSALSGEYVAGVFTTRDFAKGEVVIKTEKEERVVLRNATYQTVQIGDNEHFLVPKPAVCMNHSCAPSVIVHFGNLITVRALRDLPKGSEVTFNYLTTEYDMAQPFTCLCKSEECFGDIRGFKHLSASQQTQLEASLGLTPFIASKFKSGHAAEEAAPADANEAQGMESEEHSAKRLKRAC